ncbi:GGDEF domain-containing protein [Vibrio splendidus]
MQQRLMKDFMALCLELPDTSTVNWDVVKDGSQPELYFERNVSWLRKHRNVSLPVASVLSERFQFKSVLDSLKLNSQLLPQADISQLRVFEFLFSKSTVTLYLLANGLSEISSILNTLQTPLAIKSDVEQELATTEDEMNVLSRLRALDHERFGWLAHLSFDDFVPSQVQRCLRDCLDHMDTLSKTVTEKQRSDLKELTSIVNELQTCFKELTQNSSNDFNAALTHNASQMVSLRESWLNKAEEDISYDDAASLLKDGVSTMAELILNQDKAMKLFHEEQEVLSLRQSAIIKQLTERMESMERDIVNSHKRAVTDELTGIKNRRGFEEDMQVVIHKSRTRKMQMTLCVLDIDNFKLFNDEQGHAAGDEVLKSVGNYLQNLENKHPPLSVYRYGGEEFAVVLTGQDDLKDSRAFQQVCKQLSELKITHNGKQFSITGSFGYSSLMPEDTSIDALFQRADAALYRAKDNGKNCVMRAA